ncbi:septation initiation protein, partial [Escherichia coli]
LSLLKSTMGREASAVVGVVHSVNDPDTLLKDFIHKHITRPALTNDAMPEQNPVFKLAGVAPDYAARLDFSNKLSPAAMHKMKVRQERAEKEKAV